MKKFSLLKSFDIFFRLLIIFLISFVWIRYFVDNLWLSLFLTFVATFLIDFIFKYFKKKKNNKKQISDENSKQIQEYISSLVFADNLYVVDYFYNLTLLKHKAVKTTRYVKIESNNKTLILYPFFTYKDFTVDDLIYIINKTKKEKPTKIIICTNTIDGNTLKIAKKIPIKVEIVNGIDTYNLLMKEYNYFPKIIKLFPEPTLNYKDLISYALNKKRTKGYFISSVLVLFSSIFVPYKIYYLIIASILLVLSLVSYFNPRFNKPQNLRLLDN